MESQQKVVDCGGCVALLEHDMVQEPDRMIGLGWIAREGLCAKKGRNKEERVERRLSEPAIYCVLRCLAN